MSSQKCTHKHIGKALFKNINYELRIGIRKLFFVCFCNGAYRVLEKGSSYMSKQSKAKAEGLSMGHQQSSSHDLLSTSGCWLPFLSAAPWLVRAKHEKHVPCLPPFTVNPSVKTNREWHGHIPGSRLLSVKVTYMGGTLYTLTHTGSSVTRLIAQEQCTSATVTPEWQQAIFSDSEQCSVSSSWQHWGKSSFGKWDVPRLDEPPSFNRLKLSQTGRREYDDCLKLQSLMKD